MFNKGTKADKAIVRCRAPSTWLVCRSLLLVFISAHLTGTGITVSAATADACTGTDHDLESWQSIHKQPQTPPEVNHLALALLPCLAAENPILRDRIGYELLTRWLRADSLMVATRVDILQRLLAVLEDRDRVSAQHRSFAALILSELMRADGLSEFMTAAQRARLLELTLTALREERDFRGLDPELGWIHPVAHYADLLWRFALHPAIDDRQAGDILAAIRNSATLSVTAYQFNEGDRLARPVAIIVRRQALPSAELISWLREFEHTREGSIWGEAFQSRSGMMELHNTKLFMRALADQLQDAGIDQEIDRVLRELTGLLASIV